MLRAYNALMTAAATLVGAVASFFPAVSETMPKRRRWMLGQRGAVAAAKTAGAALGRRGPVVWVHCSSMGEFQIARPIIAQMRAEEPDMEVAVTFFSPSGYEGIDAAKEGIDAKLYLPLDSRRRVRAFLDAVRPDAAVFLVAEYWRIYLDELQRRHLPVFLVSASVGPGSVFRRWYGKWWRQALTAYRCIFTVNDASARDMLGFGANEAICEGNPLWDNALEAAAVPWHDPVLDAFSSGSKKEDIIVAGSVHLDADLQLLSEAAAACPGKRFIIVPHELGDEANKAIADALGFTPALYSEGADAARGARAIIVDAMGMLRLVYRYGGRAYVGGGFTRKLHSVAEPAAYGIPVAFGPVVGRQSIAGELLADGRGRVVATGAELARWLQEPLADAMPPTPCKPGASKRIAARIMQAAITHNLENQRK